MEGIYLTLQHRSTPNVYTDPNCFSIPQKWIIGTNQFPGKVKSKKKVAVTIAKLLYLKTGFRSFL